MAKKKSYDTNYLTKLARTGAEATLHRLHEEIAAIERTFPELGTARGRHQVVAQVQNRARRMTAASRKAVSARMKRYWAERRKVTAAGAAKGG